jgi:hypothetical protein
MTHKTRLGIAVLCFAVALLAGIASAAGIFLRGDGSFESVTSERGEEYKMATTGVYAYNAQRVVAEGVGWDVATLLLAIPTLIVSLPALAQGSLRGRLLTVGILGYLFYQYLMYAVTWAFGPLFLLYVAIYALSLTAMVWIISTIRLAGLAERFTEAFPRRGMTLLSAFLAVLLLLMWIPRVLTSQGGGMEVVLDGQTTLVVQALDLGLIVPLALFTAVAAWRGKPVGYLLSAAVVVKALAMAVAISAMLLSAWAYEGTLEVGALSIFGAVAGASLWLGICMYRSMCPSAAGGKPRKAARQLQALRHGGDRA